MVNGQWQTVNGQRSTVNVRFWQLGGGGIALTRLTACARAMAGTKLPPSPPGAVTPAASPLTHAARAHVPASPLQVQRVLHAMREPKFEAIYRQCALSLPSACLLPRGAARHYLTIL